MAEIDTPTLRADRAASRRATSLEIEWAAGPDRIGRRRSRRLRIVGVASIAACSLTGCATSEHAVSKVRAQVSVRNEQRFQTAEAGLRAQGYVFADAEVH